MDRTIRNAIVGHATRLPVEDLYIHIPDKKLLGAVDSMRFEHVVTWSGVVGEKSDAKMTPYLSRWNLFRFFHLLHEIRFENSVA
jgi:hypothetical protein